MMNGDASSPRRVPLPHAQQAVSQSASQPVSQSVRDANQSEMHFSQSPRRTGSAQRVVNHTAIQPFSQSETPISRSPRLYTDLLCHYT
eukprot:256193-Prorocentrum_minimum.AAC.1